MRYFITPHYCVPLNAKVGSTGLARQMLAAFYPEWDHRLRTAAYPPGKGEEILPLHSFVPSTKTPDRPVLMLVRSPLDRFLSGVAYLELDLDAAIRSLTTGERVPGNRGHRKGGIRTDTNIHFIPQATMPYGETHLFRFPDHLEEAVAALGMTLPRRMNVTPRPKASATEQQRQAILAHYAADVEMYDSITHPNTVIAAPTPVSPSRP
jgi:hypothetical protein